MTSRKGAKPSKAPQRYGEAVEELEEILEALENDTIDVDDLATKVKRASELVKFCREKITRTKVEIEQIVADLESFEDGDEEDEAQA